MHLADCIRISWQNIWGQKRRTLMVVVVIGALFSILMAVCLVVKGIENAVINFETQATDGKVLMLATVDQTFCGESCDLKVEVSRAQQIVEKYDGETHDGKVYRSVAGMFYEMPEVLSSNIEGQDYDGKLPKVAVSAETARKWLKMSLQTDATPKQKLKLVANVTDKADGKVVGYSKMIGGPVDAEPDAKYYVADLLPAAVGVVDLSLSSVGDGGNVLNLVLGSVVVGDSLNFVLQPDGDMQKSEMQMSEIGQLWAVFPDVESAYEYSRDKANFCDEVSAMMQSCNVDYGFLVQPAIGDPIGNVQSFVGVWSVLRIFVGVFLVVAVIVVLTTFMRLVRGDTKTVALYQALGASRGDIYKLYLIHLLMVCGFAVIFALLVALLVVFLLNIVNQVTIAQVFTLGYGEMVNKVWLIGVCPEVYITAGVILLMAPVGILLNLSVFSDRNISRQLK